MLETALHKAVREENFNDVIKFLESGTDPNDPDHIYPTLFTHFSHIEKKELGLVLTGKPLHNACMLGNKRIVKALLKYGAKIFDNNCTVSFQKTAEVINTNCTPIQIALHYCKDDERKKEVLALMAESEKQVLEIIKKHDSMLEQGVKRIIKKMRRASSTQRVIIKKHYDEKVNEVKSELQKVLEYTLHKKEKKDVKELDQPISAFTSLVIGGNLLKLITHKKEKKIELNFANRRLSSGFFDDEIDEDMIINAK